VNRDFKGIEDSLLKCWSRETSSKWTVENPSCGQCGVTALVINDLFGGRILRTRIDDQWHYYNWIDGQRFDFTRNQFRFEFDYQDIASNRDEAFTDTDEFQYQELKKCMEKENQNMVWNPDLLKKKPPPQRKAAPSKHL